MTVKNEKHRALVGSLALAAILAGAGVYILLTTAAPVIFVKRKINIATVPVVKKEKRLIIPQQGINELISSEGVGALEKGVWQRYPERGKPGAGNFILAAHRFVMGRWPGETIRKSPFYHVDGVKVGDTLYVDWNGRRFSYQVTKTYKVKPNAFEVEAPSKQHKLTLYTCTLNGSADGRLVIEAVLQPAPVAVPAAT